MIPPGIRTRAVVDAGRDLQGECSISLAMTVGFRYFGRNHGNCIVRDPASGGEILVAVDIVSYKRTAFRTMPDYWSTGVDRIVE